MRYMVMMQLASGIDTFLNIISVVLIVYAMMTWFMRPNSPVYIFFARIADVILTPFRPIGRWLFNQGLRIDLTVWLALLAIRVLQSALRELIFSLMY